MAVIDFQFACPTRIIFGCGRISELGREVADLAAQRVLLVTDEGLVQTGIADRVRSILCGAGLEVEMFAAVTANPRDADCRAAADAALAAEAQAIVGLGGGSALDTAKAASALVTNGGMVKTWEDPRRLEQRPLPTVCVPTTAGTGAEVTFVAVITDEANHYKMTLLDTKIAPRVALIDPELTYSLPPQLTAATGIDALAHAIECYTCRVAQPISDALAISAVRLIASALPTATADGTNAEARTAMALGSVMAGMAFGNADVGAVHCMAESVGGLFDTPHGLAVAAFLPVVTEYNSIADPAKHADIARALGVEATGLTDLEAAQRGVEALGDLVRSLGLPRLRDLISVEPGDLVRLAHMADQHVCSPDNTRAANADDYLQLFQRAYQD